MAVNPTAFTPEVIEAYKNAAAKRGALTAMVNYYRNLLGNLFQGNFLAQDWGLLEVPTLMIWGEQDTALGKELTYGTEKYVKNLQIHYIANASHWVQQEQPTLVNQYIHEFLASSAAPS